MTTFQPPAVLKTAVVESIGEENYNKLNPEELKIACAIAQAGIENEKGVFNIKRQAGFIAFIDKQDINSMSLPDEIYRDMFDVLCGILLALGELQPQTKESYDLLYKNKLILYRILYAQPDKLPFCVFDAELITALQLSRMILSDKPEQKQLAAEFVSFLLFHDQNYQLGDLVGYDQKSRDFIMKQDFIKVWEVINGKTRIGPPSYVLDKQRQGAQEEESKNGIKTLKGLKSQLEKVEEESEQHSVMHDVENDIRQSQNRLPSRNDRPTIDAKSVEQIQQDLDKLKLEMVSLIETQKQNKILTASIPTDQASSSLINELAQIKAQRETDLTEIKANAANLQKMKDQVQNVLKKIREEFTTNKTETAAQLDQLKNGLRTTAGVDTVSQRRPGSALTVDSHTIINMQDQMEKLTLANLRYADEVKQLREVTVAEAVKEAFRQKIQSGLAKMTEESKDDAQPKSEEIAQLRKESEENKTNLAKLKENLQNVLKKVKDEFTANKNETQTAIESIQNQLKTLPASSSAPATQAQPVSKDYSADINTIKTQHQASEEELRKKIEEANSSVAKLKESVQTILKKVKDEFTANKTETQTAIESIQNQLKALPASSSAPATQAQPVSKDYSADINAIKTQHLASEEELKKKIEEANSSVTKLKESVQTILKKVKEEFTQSKTETQTAIEGLQKELKSQPVQSQPVVSQVQPAPNQDLTPELGTLKIQITDIDANFKKQIEEANGSVTKLKENIQSILKKVKDEFTANKTETQAAIDSLKSEIAQAKSAPVAAGAHVTIDHSADITKLQTTIDSSQKQTTELIANHNKIQAAIDSLQTQIKALPASSPTPVTQAQPVSKDYSADINAIKTQHLASEEELKKKIEEANSSVAKLKESVQTILKKVKEEFTQSKTETSTAIEGLKKDVQDIQSAQSKVDVVPAKQIVEVAPVMAAPVATSLALDSNTVKKLDEATASITKLQATVDSSQKQTAELVASQSKIQAAIDSLQTQIKALPTSSATSVTQAKPVAIDHSEDIIAIKTQHKASEEELKKQIEEANIAVAKMKENVQTILKKVKEEFTQNKTETQTAIENLQKELKQQPPVVQSQPINADATQTVKASAEQFAAELQAVKAELSKKIESSTSMINQLKAAQETLITNLSQEISASKTEVKAEIAAIAKQQQTQPVTTQSAPTNTAELETLKSKVQAAVDAQTKKLQDTTVALDEMKSYLKTEIQKLQAAQSETANTIQTIQAQPKQEAQPQVTTFALDEMKSYFKTEIQQLKVAQSETANTIQTIQAQKKPEPLPQVQASAPQDSKASEKETELRVLINQAKERLDKFELSNQDLKKVLDEVPLLRNELNHMLKSKNDQQIAAPVDSGKIDAFQQELVALNTKQSSIETQIKKDQEQQTALIAKLEQMLKEQHQNTEQKLQSTLDDANLAISKIKSEQSQTLVVASPQINPEELGEIKAKQQASSDELKLMIKQSQLDIEGLRESLSKFEHKVNQDLLENKQTSGPSVADHEQIFKQVGAIEDKLKSMQQQAAKLVELEVKSGLVQGDIEALKDTSKKQTKAIKKLLNDSRSKAAEPTVPIEDHEQLKDETEAFKTQLNDQLQAIKTDLALQIEAVKTQQAEVQSQNQGMFQQLTLGDETLEKKLRGLQKKARAELDDKVGKLKAELSLMQSNFQIQEEKLNAVEAKLISLPDQREVISPLKQQPEVPEMEKKIHALKKGFKALKDGNDAQLQNQTKDIQGILLRMKKQEIVSQTLQDILNSMDTSRLPQIAGPIKRNNTQMTTDQMKRLLSLIENNAQANALQRETTLNILLRIELIEQTVKLISSHQLEKPFKSLIGLRKDVSTEEIRRNSSGERKHSESQDYMAVVGNRRNKKTQSPKGNSNSRSPDPNIDNLGNIQAFVVNDLSMYGVVSQSARASNKRFMHKSIPPTFNQSSDMVRKNESPTNKKRI